LKFSIISIGTELSLGLILNTNSRYIAETLTDIGLECNYMLTVRDNEEDILSSLKICSGLSDIIIISGGLGPTDDDITRAAVAKYLNASLIRVKSLDSSSLRFLKYVKNDRIIENLLRQSYIPGGSEPIKPRLGSASGFIVKKNAKLIFSIPGVPREMKDMLGGDVVPFIRKVLAEKNLRTGQPGKQGRHIKDTYYSTEAGQVIKKTVLLSTDISESQTEFLIKDIKPLAQGLNIDIGITANPGLIKILLVSRSGSLKDCEKNLKIVEKAIRLVMKEHIYWKGEGAIGDSIKKAIKNSGRKITISTAESITGGLISSLITDTSGSSGYFLGSIISYTDDVKKSLLDVDKALIEKKGSVSADVCLKMADGAMRIFGSDFALSATGVAGPTSPEKGKKIGLVYAGITGPGGYKEIHEKKFSGTRADIKFRTAQFILNRLRLAIIKDHRGMLA